MQRATQPPIRTARPRTWLFDLDNTLHDANAHIFPQLGRAMVAYISHHLDIQPDEATAAVRARHLPAATEKRLVEAERQRVRPRFQSRHYGLPGYARLTADSAAEILRGADDGAQMGAYHDLYEAQREANLRARLDQHTPAGMTVGLLFAD